MICYLAQKYHNNESAAIALDNEVIPKLIMLGFTVYSPIQQTHFIHEYLIHNICPYCNENQEVKTDQGLMWWSDDDAECQNCFSHFTEADLDIYWNKQMDYVGHDLQIIESLAWGAIPEGQRGLYQPNLVIIFADDCITEGYYVDPMTQEEWDCRYFVDPKKSHGAKAEYDFAQQHHIACYRLTEVVAKGTLEGCERI